MAADPDLLAADRLLCIEIDPPLPCGMAECGQLARRARIERDPRFASLWRLLPICDAHMRSLDAAAEHLSAPTETTPDQVPLAPSPSE